MTRILIVDDDDQLRNSFQRLLKEEGYETLTAPSGEAALPLVERGGLDLAILDVRLPGMDGLEVFKRIRARHPKLPVLVMTAFATTNAAIEATSLGAFDYVLKPFEIPEMLDLISQALEAGRFMRSTVRLDQPPDQISDREAIVGRSKPMQELYKAIGRAAPTDATVLIRGESGTGKELVARALYHHSLRATKPFQVINCVAIPENLLESELFGYEKGAFTGAVARRIGKIEQAHGGTVFLDEIGDMPLSIQAKILRLLQERSLERLGGRDAIRVDVRIIAATNRNLEEALESDRFREDLYYRLNVVSLTLPPLRERTEDIGLLADYFLARFSKEMEVPNPGLTPEARLFLQGHPWQGNVRELANVMEKAVIFSRGRPIGPDDLTPELRGRGQGAGPELDQGSVEEITRRWIREAFISRPGHNLFAGLTDRFAEMVIAEALTLTGGNRTRAAKLLGLSRPTLLSKIDKYGLRTETNVRREEGSPGG